MKISKFNEKIEEYEHIKWDIQLAIRNNFNIMLQEIATILQTNTILENCLSYIEFEVRYSDNFHKSPSMIGLVFKCNLTTKIDEYFKLIDNAFVKNYVHFDDNSISISVSGDPDNLIRDFNEQFSDQFKFDFTPISDFFDNLTRMNNLFDIAGDFRVNYEVESRVFVIEPIHKFPENQHCQITKEYIY